jgi:hypothetical protein
MQERVSTANVYINFKWKQTDELGQTRRIGITEKQARVEPGEVLGRGGNHQMYKKVGMDILRLVGRMKLNLKFQRRWTKYHEVTRGIN